MSPQPRVLVTRNLPRAVEDRLKQNFNPILNPNDTLYNPATMIDAARGVQAILTTVTDKIDSTIIAALAPSLKIIATFSVGHDHIDLDAAKAHNITVTNTPDTLIEATADLAFLLLLGAARRCAEGDAMMRRREWKGWGPLQLLGADLHGKRLGIVGMGQIGRAMARRARGFGLTIHYHNRRRLDATLEHDAIYHPSLESLLPVSDFLSLNCASTPQTRHLINRETIKLMPHGAILINSARGDLVDDDALIEALTQSSIAAAGLDVFNHEPNFDRRYADLPNTLILPHLGSATIETRTAMGMRAIDNLTAYFDGDTPRDCIA